MFDVQWFQELVNLSQQYSHAHLSGADWRINKRKLEVDVADCFFLRFSKYDDFKKLLRVYAEHMLPEVNEQLQMIWDMQEQAEVGDLSALAEQLSAILAPFAQERKLITMAEERHLSRFAPTANDDDLFRSRPGMGRQRQAGALVSYLKTWAPRPEGIGGEGAQSLIRMDVRPHMLGVCFSHVGNVLAGPTLDYLNDMMMWLWRDIIIGHYAVDQVRVFTHIPWDVTPQKTTEIFHMVVPNMTEGRFDQRMVFTKPAGLHDGFSEQEGVITVYDDDGLRDVIQKHGYRGPQIEATVARFKIGGPS